MSEELVKRLTTVALDLSGRGQYLNARYVMDAVSALSRPAPAVQVPEGYDAARAAYVALTNSVEFEDGDARYVASSKVMEAFDRFFAAAPTPAPVATEAVAQECDCGALEYCDICAPVREKPVAQGGGVDVEKVMALVEEYGRMLGLCGMGHANAVKPADDTLAQIRALLSASPAGVGGWQPIETAPRDSSRVLIGGYSNEGEWRTREAWWCLPYEGAEPEQCFWRFDGDRCALDKGVHGVGFTNWQPLPAAPAIANQENGHD